LTSLYSKHSSILTSCRQRLYDRLWFFITESLLAFTIFRDEFDVPFALMFGFLLFIKSFHWLASDRIEWVCLWSSSSQSNSHLGRWTNDHIQVHHCYFTLGCQLSLQSCSALIASCSTLPLSVLYLPALEEWCSLQVRCVSHLLNEPTAPNLV
jgi:hypothetical protein